MVSVTCSNPAARNAPAIWPGNVMGLIMDGLRLPGATGKRSPSMMRPMTFPGQMAGAFRAAGFEQVTETMLTIRMDFTSFDDYWVPLINGQGSLASYLATL